MKRMNNYEAPVAEVIEMTMPVVLTMSLGSGNQGSNMTGNASSNTGFGS